MPITYPPEMLPSPDPDDRVEIIVCNGSECRQEELERLRAALKFYAEATPEDFANDNGFNAAAALAR